MGALARLIGLTVAGACLLAGANRHESLAAVAAVGLVPWWLALARARLAGAAASGALLCIAYGVLIATFIPNALQGLGVSPENSIVAWLIVCAWGGAPVFVGLALLARGVDGRSTATRALTLAAGAFALEWWISAVWWGVPWGLLGYTQLGALGVAQLATAGGVPLISAWLVGIQVAAADVLRGRSGALRIAAALAAGWVALLVAGLPLSEALRPSAHPGRSFDLLVIQPNLPRNERWVESLQPLNLHRVRRFADRAFSAEGAGVDALVLPENLLTAPLEARPALASKVRAWVDDLDVPVLTGLVLAADEPDRGLYRSAVVWLAPSQGIAARIDKRRAVPVIESGRRFLGDALAAALLGPAARAKRVAEAAAAEPLRGPVPLAPALCYEVLFPRIVAARRTPGSVALVNLADDSWAHGTEATRHLTQIARFRAIEQRLPLVRVAHGGLSAVIDPFGRVVEQLPRHAYASTRVELAPAAPPSLGERLGILGLPVAAGLGVWWGAGWLGARRSAASHRGKER